MERNGRRWILVKQKAVARPRRVDVHAAPRVRPSGTTGRGGGNGDGDGDGDGDDGGERRPARLA